MSFTPQEQQDILDTIEAVLARTKVKVWHGDISEFLSNTVARELSVALDGSEYYLKAKSDTNAEITLSIKYNQIVDPPTFSNKLDKVDATPQNVASTVDFDGGILVGSGYFGPTSPNIVFDAAATSYILDNPNISLTIRKQYDNNAEASLTMAKATSVDGVASLSSNGAGTSYSNINLFSGSATTPTYQQFTLENADGGGVGEFEFTGSGLDIENASSDGSAIKMPDDSWIRPQTENASLYITNGVNPSDIYSGIHLNQGQLKINGGDGVSNLGYLWIIDSLISLQVVDSSTGAPKDTIVLGDGNIELVTDGNRVQVQNNSMLFGDNTKTQLSFNNTTIELLTQANSIYLSETNGLKIDIPSKGANKVLTSDVNGFATWESPIWGQVNSVVGGLNTDIDNTDTVNPIINVGQNGLDIQGVDAVDSSAIKMPDNSWIRPQTAQQSLIITNGTNPSTTNSTLQLNNGSTLISAGDGTTQTASLQMDASNITLLQGGKPILDATPTATTLFNPSQASAFQIDSTYNWNYLKARFTDGIEVLAGKVKIDTLTAETPIKTLGRNASNEIIEFDNVDLQIAYDNGELITTDATNGALTLKRGSALDTDNVLEVKNGAGTTNASITGNGESTFNGDMTLLNTKNGTWTVDESIRRLNFYSSDVSGSGVGNVGWIDTRVTNTFGTGCDMVFGTAPSGGEATESMRLSRIGDLTVIGDGTFGGSGSFGSSINIDNVLALTSATFYKKDGFNNWATGVFNSSNDFNIFLYDKTTGAYSSSFIKLTHDTQQIQLQKDTLVSGSIIQGGVTDDTITGIQGDSLRVDDEGTFGGVLNSDLGQVNKGANTTNWRQMVGGLLAFGTETVDANTAGQSRYGIGQKLLYTTVASNSPVLNGSSYAYSLNFGWNGSETDRDPDSAINGSLTQLVIPYSTRTDGSLGDMAYRAKYSNNSFGEYRYLVSSDEDGNYQMGRGRILQGGVTDDTTTGTQTDSLRVEGDAKADSFTLSALNTAPASATDTGTTGEIRWDADYMYVCTATDTWKRSAIATW